MFEDIGKLINLLLWMCVVFVPLGLWKLIEILVWLAHHVEVK